MERFTLTLSENSMWTVFDSETGFSIKFREGMFNETQEVVNPNYLPTGVDLASWTAKAMNEIGDYMANEHLYISVCNIYARRSALWHLSHESWWKTIVAACNSLIVDWESNNLAQSLFMELEDFFDMSQENPAGLCYNEKENLLGAISLLNEEEAAEVLKLVHVFWHEYADIDTNKWARDLLWWPCWANTIIGKLDNETDE